MVVIKVQRLVIQDAGFECHWRSLLPGRHWRWCGGQSLQWNNQGQSCSLSRQTCWYRKQAELQPASPDVQRQPKHWQWDRPCWDPRRCWRWSSPVCIQPWPCRSWHCNGHDPMDHMNVIDICKQSPISYPVWGENVESKVSLAPFRGLSARSMVAQIWLSVVHFSVNVRPYSFILYLVSKLPPTLPESVLDDPPELNSTPDAVLVLTSSLSRLKW